jgi:hypothetical protein
MAPMVARVSALLAETETTNISNPNPFADFLGNLFNAVFLQSLIGTCTGCRRTVVPFTPAFADWAVQTFLRVPVGAKCPDCQTNEERAEIAIRQATGPKYKIDGLQLVQEDPKPEGGDDDEGQSETKAG